MSEQTDTDRATGGHRRILGQPIRLWLYVALVVLSGIIVVFGPLRHSAPLVPARVVAIPWWAIFLLATAAELASVELPIRKTNLILTLNDAVIVLAILGRGPFVTAIVMACSLGFVQAIQRHAPVQVIFNFGAQMLAIPLYYLLLRVFIQPAAIFSIRSVGGYLLTVILLSEISNIEISAAMYLSESDFTIVTEGLASTAPVVALIALPNAVFAMIVLVMTVAAPVVLLTIPIPVFVTVAAYRAHIAGRKQQRDIDNLFAATRILSYSKSVTTGAVDFLNHIGAMFHARLVELTLLPASPGSPALVTRIMDGAVDDVMSAAPLENLPEGLAEALGDENLLVTKKLGLETPLARVHRGGRQADGHGRLGAGTGELAPARLSRRGAPDQVRRRLPTDRRAAVGNPLQAARLRAPERQAARGPGRAGRRPGRARAKGVPRSL